MAAHDPGTCTRTPYAAVSPERQRVQGALYGARALATGTGPLLFAAMFSAFTKSDSPLPYFPGAPFLLGTLLMTVAIGYSLLIDNRYPLSLSF